MLELGSGKTCGSCKTKAIEEANAWWKSAQSKYDGATDRRTKEALLGNYNSAWMEHYRADTRGPWPSAPDCKVCNVSQAVRGLWTLLMVQSEQAKINLARAAERWGFDPDCKSCEVSHFLQGVQTVLMV